MISEGIQKILDISREFKTLEIDDRLWSNRELDRIPLSEETQPEAMNFDSLTGLKEFATGFKPPAEIDQGAIFYHVESPVLVSLCGQLQPENFNTRFKYATAEMGLSSFQFSSYGRDHWYDLEMFIISLQSLFVPSETLDNIMDNAGNIVNEMIINHNDDRMSQSLEVRTGLSQRGKVKVENPVKLRPWRTFREVDQPEGDFILRFKGGVKDQRPVQASLWEADGGRWRIQAMQSIKEWLEFETDLKAIA